jgi:DNA mismatch repair ATPase MutL
LLLQQDADEAGTGSETATESQWGAPGAAERELERVFDKADFKRMTIIGQFNLGFILAR